jgi:hypothetical protein
MNRIKQIRRLAAVLAGLTCAWLGAAVVAPAAFAVIFLARTKTRPSPRRR